MSDHPEIYRSEEQIAFFNAVGQAITNWGLVEWQLTIAASRAFDQSSDRAMRAAFNSVENFRSKLAFVDNAIATIKLDEALAMEWRKLRDECSALSALRNRIAHHRLLYFLDAEPGRGMALVAASEITVTAPGRNIPPSGALCLKDIDLAARRFGMLHSKLASWYCRASGVEDPFGANVQQEMRSRSLGQLRRQIHEALAPRAKSSLP